MEEKIKYVYILSQRYSGSTLLSFLLASHPDVSTIGERRKFFIKSIAPDGRGSQHCSCGVLFKDCHYWNAIKARLLKRVPDALLSANATEFQLFKNRHLNRIAYQSVEFCMLNKVPYAAWPFTRKIERLCLFNRVLTEEILNMNHNRVFLDSSKVLSNALFLSLIREFEFHVIWLVRDPRAQVNSALKYNNWTADHAARRWKKEMMKNERTLKEWKVSWTLLRYESLCRAPEKELTRLFEFIGIEPSAFSLDFRRQEQHIMGNAPMRLGKDRKIEERRDWQKSLSPEQIKSIERITAAYRNFFSQAD